MLPSMNEFFDDLGKRWVAAAKPRGAQIEAPTLDAQIALELLELARVAAHTRERRFAPLSCYLAGVAAERLRAVRPELDDGEVAAYIREVWKAIDSPASER